MSTPLSSPPTSPSKFSSEESDSSLSPLPLCAADLVAIEHHREKLFGKKLSVLIIDGKKWLIGVQVAQLLQRETYNLYRSMKVKNIVIHRASAEQVDYLLKSSIVKSGTRSITFVAFDQCLTYISEEIKKVGIRKKKDKYRLKPFVLDKPITKAHSTSPTPTITTISSPVRSLLTAFDFLCEAAEVEYSLELYAASANSTMQAPLALATSCGLSTQDTRLLEYYENLNKQPNACIMPMAVKI